MNNIFFIPVGTFFGKAAEACYMVYAPLKNNFFLVTAAEAAKMQAQQAAGEQPEVLKALYAPEPEPQEVTTDTFVTLHLLLNEKCNFHCVYCYSAQGRSNAELTDEQIEPVLRWFLSAERKAPKKRTVMFMGGGEPVLSWKKLVAATELAKQIAEEHAKRDSLLLERAGHANREVHLRLMMELITLLTPDNPPDCHSTAFAQGGMGVVNAGTAPGGVTVGDAPSRVVIKRVDREEGACYDVDEFFNMTRAKYPEGVIEDGKVVGYDNEMAIRYLDRVVVNDQDYEVRFKGGVTVTV